MKSFLQRVVEWLLKRCLLLLPERARNMICIVSLVHYIHGKDRLSDQTIETVNEIMNFGFSANAGKFPMSISSIIWKGVDRNELCSNDVLCVYRELDQAQIDSVISAAKRSNRNWNMYENETLLKEHLSSLLSKHRSSVFMLS